MMPIEPLHILHTNKTPEINFRHDTHTISIIGVNCDPGDEKFFLPIEAWFDTVADSNDLTELNLIVEIKFISTISLAHFRRLFFTLQKMAPHKRLSVVWRTPKDLKRTIGEAKTLEEILPASVPFNLVLT